MTQPLLPSAPDRRLLFGETRALLDLAAMPFSFLTPRRERLHAPPVIVLPGFGAGERSMRPLRAFLKRHGLDVEDWGLGVNRAGLDMPHGFSDLSAGWRMPPPQPYRREGGVAYLVDRMIERVRGKALDSTSPVALVGWSLGGTIAREVGRELPDAVSQVITMGSPVIGGPKYTAAAQALARRGLDIDWIESQVRMREARPIEVPITAIVSRSDAIVDYRAARDLSSPRVEHIEVDVAHLGMGINRQVWKLVLERLTRDC